MDTKICDSCSQSIGSGQSNQAIVKTVSFNGKSFDVAVRVQVSGSNSDLCPDCVAGAAHVAGGEL